MVKTRFQFQSAVEVVQLSKCMSKFCTAWKAHSVGTRQTHQPGQWPKACKFDAVGTYIASLLAQNYKEVQ